MQPLGQHFLRNRSLPKKIIAALRIEQKLSVIELGPGHGELTVPLLHACAERGAALTTIEKDPKLAEELERRAEDILRTTHGLTAAHWQRIEGDLRVHVPSFVASLGTAPYAITGNIPYYLTAHLFRMLEELPRRPERAVFLIQKEVAERAVAAPPKMNKLAASVQYWSTLKLLFKVPREEFDPPPKVESAVLLLETLPHMRVRNAEESARYYCALAALFAHPRKTIANNLRDSVKHVTDAVRRNSSDTYAEILERCAIIAGDRPQTLNTSVISCIASHLF